MYKYELNKDFGIDVEEAQQDNEWKLAALNVDLALKKSILDDAKNNNYLLRKDYEGYLSNIVRAKRELLEIHVACLEVAKRILGGK